MAKKHRCPGCGAEFDCETGTARFEPGNDPEPEPDDEPAAERPEVAAWWAQHHNRAAVERWLKANPPPEGWRGTPLDYAYTERPDLSAFLFHTNRFRR